MQINQPENQEKLREVMERYAPVVGGRPGLVGEALKLVSRAVDLAPAFGAAASSAPVPGVVYQSRNLAGQNVITNDQMIATTFKRMETALQKSFSAATKPDALTSERENFLKLRQQIEADAAVLASACTITNPEGPGKYKFTIEPHPGQHISLAKAFDAVQHSKKAGVDVEFLRFGNKRQVIMMRPVSGFKNASRKAPTA